MGRGSLKKGKNVQTPQQKAALQRLKDKSTTNWNYGDRDGEIKTKKEENGNISYEYTSVRFLPYRESDTMGLGAIPARLRTYKHTGFIDPNGKFFRITHKAINERNLPGENSGKAPNLGVSILAPAWGHLKRGIVNIYGQGKFQERHNAAKLNSGR